MIANLVNQNHINSVGFNNPTIFLIVSLFLALIPIAVALLTSFVKVSVVLGVLKNALGTQHAPSNMISLSLSLALTLIVMKPVFEETLEIGKSYQWQEISKGSGAVIISTVLPLLEPWKRFLESNTGAKELTVFKKALEKQGTTEVANTDCSMLALIPAFLISELKEGFCMAFILLIPFLVIDLIVANILMGLGMIMLSPVIISLPLKLIMFVYSDAWLILSQALLKSYQN
jgi:flagellar biosynthesis protein FliP